MTESWAEVACRTPAAAVDLLSEYFVELSGVGVCTENREVDTFSVEGLDDGRDATIKAYFLADETLASQVERLTLHLAELAAVNPGWTFAAPVVTIIKQEEWADSWKEYFKPFRVGERLVVKPTWEEFAAGEGDLVLEIDPGMAFGTGSHATTRLCLEAIEGICRRTGEFTPLAYPFPTSCLDVGTGSGILGIGAILMGMASVTGIDIDPEAVAVAADNAGLNGVAGRMAVSTTPLQQITGTFDIVVANILAEELVRLAPHLVDRTTPGGFLILSGILTEKETLVTDGFALSGMVPLPPCREGEWSCLVYHRVS